ncbi:MAG: flagellar protein export ATPase FliI [Proteobacteria bacterium]|nr:flagellar protein export ATPase FliI [Pseudomonadota bacterium]MDE3207445.1 flagellar protein export ATPase FliI [Pseudomonadota bacterium]
MPPWVVYGRLTRVVGLVMEAIGLHLPIGSNCKVFLPWGGTVEAEVVGFAGDHLYLMPSGEVHGLMPGALVAPSDSNMPYPLRPGRRFRPRRRNVDRVKQVPVGMSLLGRVLDGHGQPLDAFGAIDYTNHVPLQSRPYNALMRAPINQVLDVGVRAINALLTVGRGQRMGLFAGSGVGKSVLLGMMARYTDAEVIVVGLIGERGREVKEFIENILGQDGLRRAIVVAAPADTPPLQRLHGAAYATAIAEYFRDCGKHVLLIMDSLTRVAMAQREISLAIGEPPATKGYPPSVFARLPQLVERAGNGPPGGGSITAFYTVLTEGDDPQDPIADAARAILDGHIVLSRELADSGHYPAIDIEASVSRVFSEIAPNEQMGQARRFKHLYARYRRSSDLISVGAYSPGHDSDLDEAVARYPELSRFLQQDMYKCETYSSSVHALQALFS